MDVYEMELICKQCNKKFNSSCRTRRNCSRKCYGISMRGKINLNTAGPNNGSWKGFKLNKHGYIHVFKPNHPYRNREKRVKEHRLIMEKNIGRYLKKSEVVHHVNGIKHDNRLKNLILFKNQSEHLRHHNLNRIYKKGILAGNKSGTAKLNWKKVDAIRNDSKKGILGIMLSKKYKISKASVSLIINNKTWKKEFE